MSGFEDIAKKAFYMGVGFASYAQEKANDNFKDLKVQAQNLADEMVERGKMSTEEARKFVDDLVEQAQQETVTGGKTSSESREPRKIEIVDEDEQPQTSTQSEVNAESGSPKKHNPNNDDLRQQVQSLKEELRRLKEEM
jgi:polyhydroxyalkanoate synthesis regulator phasin